MQQVDKTLDLKKAAKADSLDEDPGDEFKRVYRDTDDEFKRVYRDTDDEYEKTYLNTDEDYEEIYREIEATFLENKKFVDDVFSLCAFQDEDDDDPETILLHGEGKAPEPSMAITTETIELSVKTVNAQLDLIEEKMANALIVFKNDKDIETTKIILNPPNPCSIFNNCEIILKRFPTASNFLNIEFLGNDPALNVFVIHMGALVDRFEQNNEGFLISRVTKGYKLNKAKKRKAKSSTGVK